MEHIFPIYQVDAFTDTPFRGNPAAVCYLMAPKPDEWMQYVAREMNLSETAFFAPQKNGKFSLRWFTPSNEVDLCGHATLATSHIIWQSEMVRPEETLVFETLSGELTARPVKDKIELNFPNEMPSACPLPEILREEFGDAVLWSGKNRMDYFLELSSEEILRSIEPNFHRLKQLSTRGIVITARCSNGQYDFLSRFFGPAVGVDEDPVTGSSHCGLGPYWAKKLNKTILQAFQASVRGGFVEVEPRGDRVLLRGNAVTVMQGVISAT